MKRLNNILSYLWSLLLLLTLTTCSDWEEIVVTMQGEEEVELTIQTTVPDMQASTRAQMVITEAISTIVAIAFDENDALVKKVDAVLNKTTDTSGTLKIKVPKRTRTIHFLGNYTTDNITDITTLEGLRALTTSDVSTMHYWGKASFDGTSASLPVTLYRNMAKVTLTKDEGLTSSCYIAGFVNYNTNGTMVPNNDEVGNTPTIPNEVTTSSYQADNSLGNVYYLFEHANEKDGSPLYVILEIRAKYYKVAFAAGDTYFPIVRNHGYNIHIEKIDESYGEADYTAAVNSTYPINDLVITEDVLTVVSTPTEVLNESGQTSTVTVTIPEGVTELTVNAGDAFTVTPPNGLTTNSNGSYAVTTGDYAFTLTVKEGASSGNKNVAFSGRGKYKRATGSTSIRLYEIENVTLTVSANPTNINYTANSATQVMVNIPDGITSLMVDAGNAFTVTPPNGLSANQDGSYTVSTGNYTFTLTLNNDGAPGTQLPVTFTGSGQYKQGIGSATITLYDANVPVSIVATPAVTTLNYSANAVSDLIVNVTIPKEVSTLSFESDYFDVALTDEEVLHATDGGYSVIHGADGNATTTAAIRLRLKTSAKAVTNIAGFTFDGVGEGVTVNPAVVNNITLSQSGDSNVRWQGDAALEWGVSVVQIPLPYSWFYDSNGQLIIPVGSTLRVEYETTAQSDAEIQFAEVDGEWNDDAYFFEELRQTTDNDNTMGLNLNNNTGIYANTYKDLTLTQAILTNMTENRTSLLGENDVVMAIQGGNVRLKRISVIPNNQNSGEVVLHSGTHTFTSWENDALIINREFPVGTVITINFSSGGTIKLCDLNSRMLYVPTFAEQYGYPGANNNNSYDLYMGVNQGNLVLEIVDGITLREWQTGTILATISNSYPLNGLRIESGDAVLESVVAVFP